MRAPGIRSQTGLTKKFVFLVNVHEVLAKSINSCGNNSDLKNLQTDLENGYPAGASRRPGSRKLAVK